MIQLSIPINVPLNQLSEKYLPFVDWGRIKASDIVSLPPSSLKYVSTQKLIEFFNDQKNAGFSDEDLLTVISREITRLGDKYDYSAEYRLETFLHKFCDQEFLKKYSRQILAMCKLITSTKQVSLERVPAILAMYGFVSTDVLVGLGLHSISWDKLSSTKVSLEHRYKLLSSGSYMAYEITYNSDLPDIVPVLTTEQIESMRFIHAPDIFDDYAMSFIGDLSTIHDDNEVKWDELIEYYYDGKIHHQNIQNAWVYHLNDGTVNIDTIESYIRAKLPNKTVFTAEDFL